MTELNPVADITVQYVNAPKPGKKMGNVKDVGGKIWFAYPDMLKQFSPGMVCKIEYKAGDFDGRPFNTIQKVIGNGAAPTMPKQNYASQKNPTESRQIGILAIAKECIAKIPPGELSEEKLVTVLTICGNAYDRVFGGRKFRDDMQDENPY